MDLRGKTVTIIGAGRSGMAVADLVIQLHGKAKISDSGCAETFQPEFKQWARERGVATEFDRHSQAFIEASDLIVLSPGVRFDALPVQWAQKKKISVLGEVELAYRFC